ncbi:hypothetical protein [Mesorhizobium sp. ZC-5]|uniref:hypothetical protein n=1 Tax=Mesorhizobium sp. ZC-5 TaxID=2986066 RepID=UPI0021E7E83A|nr:hypothetical protein [Mesorhizobium sp. ZC-5]MCV3242810.1 hypothetical protein [Mesorhizobium sp. ZC-5]
MPKPPVLENIVRQHAEMAAFLWTAYDSHLLSQDGEPETDDEQLELMERLEAHLDGVRVAGADGLRIAQERYAEFPEPGELFVMRMLAAEKPIPIADLNLDKVRAYLNANLPAG